MAKDPKKKKSRTARIIVSSPVTTSVISVSTPVSVPISVAATVQEVVSTSQAYVHTEAFMHSPDFVNVATFMPSFMDATTVTTSFQAASTSRVDSLFAGLDDLDLNFSLDYDDSELRLRISILSQEFDKYRKQKEKAETKQPSSSSQSDMEVMKSHIVQLQKWREEDVLEKKLMNHRITSLELLTEKQNAEIAELKKENQMLKQKVNDIQVKDSQAEATGASADPIYVNIDDEEEEEKVDYENSNVHERPSFNAFHDDDEDEDGDLTGVGSSSGLNSIIGAIVIYKPSGISFGFNPISSVSSDKVKDNEDVDIEGLTELEYPKQVIDSSLLTFADL
ncbi:hypothetical protein E3N88_00436 [Mikania micrantha]|uniref:Uncharacterized protein n=1 Tax=Mikania micrantha TaxID=192012 RepID=A0A5N6Q0S2_9ASTR|nr:hypothetical protein E3N88_00436 [Mikania micrantha]